ncbi:MAG: sigma-70 family RNA polymerase sigma factor [Planctomycetota bacterium]|nr:sigma-70 family RNA polymerase sigma factor [Planctomycetota bacterium]
MQGYKNEHIGELARQLSAGPMRLRKGYVDSAEALLGIIEPHTDYPYEFVVYRLTGYRSRRRGSAETVGGQDLIGDLHRLILEVCDSFDLRVVDYDEAAFDTPSLAGKFGVSIKTIRRWRKNGLVARRMVLSNGRKRIAFLESSIRTFAKRRRKLILRSARFTRLTKSERRSIVRQARRMVARSGCRLMEVSKRLSARTGRAPETIRYTIRNHDRRHPAEAVFGRHVPPLDEKAREVIYRCFLNGVSVRSLAQRYERTPGSIYRIVNEMRTRQLLDRKIDYIYNPQFDLPGADELILTEPPAESDTDEKQTRAPKSLPPYLASLYELPLMSPEMERWTFRKYNYLKFRADHLRKELDTNHVKSALVRRIERLLAQAQIAKNQITRANLRLVVSIARKHLHGSQTLFELVSDGNISLMRAIEKFDYSRGFKFSTYASWAIMKNFARSVPKERYRLDRFVTGAEEVMDVIGGLDGYDPHACSMSELRDSLEVVLAQLSASERSILVGHFGLNSAGRTRTLDQIGRQMGISKERVRQIERRAMEKLRSMLKPISSDLMR